VYDVIILVGRKPTLLIEVHSFKFTCTPAAAVIFFNVSFMEGTELYCVSAWLSSGRSSSVVSSIRRMNTQFELNIPHLSSLTCSANFAATTGSSWPIKASQCSNLAVAPGSQRLAGTVQTSGAIPPIPPCDLRVAFGLPNHSATWSSGTPISPGRPTITAGTPSNSINWPFCNSIFLYTIRLGERQLLAGNGLQNLTLRHIELSQPRYSIEKVP